MNLRLAATALLLLCLSSCSTCSLRDKMDNVLDSALDVVKEGMREDSIRRARMEQLRYEIDSIQANEFTRVDNSMGVMYMHKSWNGNLDANRNGLTAVVYESGEIVLISTLPACNGCPPDRAQHVHNRVELKSGHNTWAADSAYTYPLTQPYDGITYITGAKGEVLYIMKEEASEILQGLDANRSQEFTVTALYNNEVYASYKLSAEDKEAILSAYRLHQLMTELQELEAQDVEFDD